MGLRVPLEPMPEPPHRRSRRVERAIDVLIVVGLLVSGWALWGMPW